MKYRVTKAVTSHGRYYKVGDIVDNDGSLARLFGWTAVVDKPKASSPKREARKPGKKPAAKK